MDVCRSNRSQWVLQPRYLGLPLSNRSRRRSVLKTSLAYYMLDLCITLHFYYITPPPWAEAHTITCQANVKAVTWAHCPQCKMVTALIGNYNLISILLTYLLLCLGYIFHQSHINIFVEVHTWRWTTESPMISVLFAVKNKVLWH